VECIPTLVSLRSAALEESLVSTSVPARGRLAAHRGDGQGVSLLGESWGSSPSIGQNGEAQVPRCSPPTAHQEVTALLAGMRPAPVSHLRICVRAGEGAGQLMWKMEKEVRENKQPSRNPLHTDGRFVLRGDEEPLHVAAALGKSFL